MAGRPAWPGWRRVALLAFCALATLPAACVGTLRPSPPHPAAVAAAVRVLERQMDESLERGPGYSLTELEGLIAAHALGEEGAAACRALGRGDPGPLSRPPPENAGRPRSGSAAL